MPWTSSTAPRGNSFDYTTNRHEITVYYMGLNARNPVFGSLRTTVADHAICSYIDSSGYASGPIRICLFIDYIINVVKCALSIKHDLVIIYSEYVSMFCSNYHFQTNILPEHEIFVFVFAQTCQSLCIRTVLPERLLLIYIKVLM